LADNGYDGPAADTWSCGVILYVLMAGFLPFDEPTMSALFRKIGKADFSYPTWFDADVRDLLDRILVVDPNKRYKLIDIMNHRWTKLGKVFFFCSFVLLSLSTNQSKRCSIIQCFFLFFCSFVSLYQSNIFIYTCQILTYIKTYSWNTLFFFSFFLSFFHLTKHIKYARIRTS